MEKKQKIKRDVGKIVIKIVAAVLALLMVLAVAGTPNYYLTRG